MQFVRWEEFYRDIAQWEAQAYLEDSDAQLFVESDPAQAEEIYKRTGRPVLCIDNLKIYH
jgi:hypothetical protein